MTFSKKLLVAFGVLWVALSWANVARAAQVKPEKPTVKIGYASQSGAFAQLWIAAQRGYFAAEGLNKEITNPKQLVGKKVGVNQFLDAWHFSARRRLPLKPHGRPSI